MSENFTESTKVTHNGTDATNMGFADRLSTERKKKGLTQSQLGQNVGVSKNIIHRAEKGQYPKCDTLIALADYFDCSIDWLAKGKGPGPTTLSTAEPAPSYNQTTTGIGPAAPDQRIAPRIELNEKTHWYFSQLNTGIWGNHELLHHQGKIMKAMQLRLDAMDKKIEELKKSAPQKPKAPTIAKKG